MAGGIGKQEQTEVASGKGREESMGRRRVGEEEEIEWMNDWCRREKGTDRQEERKRSRQKEQFME